MVRVTGCVPVLLLVASFTGTACQSAAKLDALQSYFWHDAEEGPLDRYLAEQTTDEPTAAPTASPAAWYPEEVSYEALAKRCYKVF
jgi:hypothetical protein